VAESVTNKGKYLIATVGLNNLDLRAAVFTGTQTGVHSVDLDTVADLDAVTGVAIHSERLTLASETVTEDDTNDRANADCANLSFAAAAGVTAQGLVIYHEVSAADSGRQIVAVYTTGFPQPMDGGLNITINDYLRLT
jgi:hypothetical protein